MRLLLVGDEYPWPARSGYRQRVDRVVRTLAAEGELDLFVVVATDTAPADPPSDVELARCRTVVAGRRSQPRAQRVGRWLLTRQPRALGRRDWSAARAGLAEWSDTPYDVVWFSHANAYLALADLVQGAHVVDLDNLGSFVLRHRRSMVRQSGSTSPRDRVRRAARLGVEGIDERRWGRVEKRIADEAAAVVVCSALDRGRLGAPNVRVVENGYDPADTPERRRTAPPVMLMVGLLTYEPNRDAAGWFARAVLPLVRASVPDAQFRVVGRYDDESQVAGFRETPGVTVTGEVPDLGTELGTADIAVVPIRFGGGTRIKILEAFANRLPVVTTTVGAEGLDAVDGTHLLIGDDPQTLAEACVRLLRDPELSQQLAVQAHDLWSRRHRWSAITPTIAAIVRDAAAR